MSKWQPYNRGRSIGVKSTKGCKVVRDEEHPLGARMTIKQGQDYVSVSCNNAGKIDHTRFFNKMNVAEREYKVMQKELAKVIRAISSAKDADTRV